MITLAERVASTRERNNWTQAELARRVTQHRARASKGEVKQQSINQLELGEVENPRYLVDLAAVLKVSLKWLMGDNDFEYVADSIVRAPLISWVEAGELSDVTDPYRAGDAEEWVPISHRHENLIALRVKGDSMNLVAPEGSVIIVDLNDRDPMDGKHYVFKHGDRATFKTYRIGPPACLQPQSSDPDYGPISPQDGFEIVGRVIRKTEEI